jgi:hypothetical protein
MVSTYNNYVAFAYGIPFGMAAILFVLISIVNKRAHTFIIKIVLGIELKPDDKQSKDPSPKSSANESNKTKPAAIPRQENVGDQGMGVDTIVLTHHTPKATHTPSEMWSLGKNVDTFLYIEQEESEEKQALPWIVRFFCDLFTSAIISVLLEIIYEKCVLTDRGLIVGDPCPDFDADCFGVYNGDSHYGPIPCRNGQNITFPFTAIHVLCYGWVYDHMDTDQVLNAIGVSGGLLGIVTCIVPLVYYVSFFKKHRWMSICGIIWPLSTIIVFILIIIWTLPEAISVLTIITFSLLITMTCGGWLWAVYSSFSTPESSCTAPRCLTNCYSKLHCCFKSYPYYPFCCNKDTCRRNSGVSRQVSPQ